MLIRCPECEICYRIDIGLLPEEGRKFRCAKCGHVWLAERQDTFEETSENRAEIYHPENGGTKEPPADSANEPKMETAEPSETMETNPEAQQTQNEDQPAAESPSPEQPDAAEPRPAPEAQPATEAPEQLSAAAPDPSESGLSSDMQEMFSRLNKQTEIIDEFDKKRPALKRGIKYLQDVLHWHNPLTRTMILSGLVLLLLLSLFSFRYEITRLLPFMAPVYETFGFEAVVIGEGLEFQNVNRREYEEDYVRKLEVKGILLNTTDTELDIPQIRVELLDKDGTLLQETTIPAPTPRLAAGDRAAFMFTLTQPSSLTKYIYLTFTDGEK